MLLSILIPTYNCVCVSLVRELQRQTDELSGECDGGFGYEVIVADDGSSDSATVKTNREINGIPHCRLIECPVNVGRSRIRNFLAAQSAGRWLLYSDSHMSVGSPDFVRKYMAPLLKAGCCDGNAELKVYDGGVSVCGYEERWRGNLRFKYEKQAEPYHTAEHRQMRPLQSFHTANFLAPRQVMIEEGFDERFPRYGFEDVLFGKRLCQRGIAIEHITNPLMFASFETNAEYLAKVEAAVLTLAEFRDDLFDCSPLLMFAHRTRRILPPTFWRLWHRLFGAAERRNLAGRHPSLLVLKLYKLGFLWTMGR